MRPLARQIGHDRGLAVVGDASIDSRSLRARPIATPSAPTTQPRQELAATAQPHSYAIAAIDQRFEFRRQPPDAGLKVAGRVEHAQQFGFFDDGREPFDGRRIGIERQCIAAITEDAHPLDRV